MPYKDKTKTYALKRRRYAELRAAGLCVYCKTTPTNGRYNCEACAQHEAEQERLRHLKLRKTVYAAYGDKCACPPCGTTDFDFLTVDHINGGGEKDRDEIGHGATWYKWIIENNFPKTLQLLCANCNLSKLRNGQCHHLSACSSPHAPLSPAWNAS